MAGRGNWIRVERARLGLKQTDLAGLLGVTGASISRWEGGQQRITRALAVRIRRALKDARAQQRAVAAVLPAVRQALGVLRHAMDPPECHRDGAEGRDA